MIFIRSTLGMEYARTIIGYHGCTERVARQLLGGSKFSASENDYDWLGKGVYFWEYGPHRAQRFIKSKLRRERRHAKTAVVGAVIQLGRCFDLLDTRFTHDLGDSYALFESAIMAAGQPLPTNSGFEPERNLRRLDCAMINWYLDRTLRQRQEYQTVRGCFVEGGDAYPQAGFRVETHVQVAVRDPTCILGVFRPMLRNQ